MLSAEQVAHRVSRELSQGATRRPADTLPREVRSVLERELGTSAQALALSGTGDIRVVCTFGVFDLSNGIWLLREVPPGVSAADVQARLTLPLLCGPGLAEVRVD